MSIHLDSVGNTVEKNSSIFFLIRMCCYQQGHAGSKTLQKKQNPPVLNWRCQLKQVDLYKGHKMVVLIIIIITIIITMTFKKARPL